MLIIIVILLIIIVFLLASKKSSEVESLGSSTKKQSMPTFNISSEPAEIVIVEPYKGSTKLAAIKAIREVNHVINLRDAKAIVDNGGELELYIAKDQLFKAKEMLSQTGLKF